MSDEERLFYLVIKTGYEGIEKLCHLTDDKEDAKAQKEKALEAQLRQNEEDYEALIKEGLTPHILSREEVADFFCIQKWDGDEFKCVCEKLGVAPSRRMLR